MNSELTSEGSTSAPNPSFEPHPEHAEAVQEAISAIQKLAQEDPDFVCKLSDTFTTEEAQQLLDRYGITISTEALWRHRGSLLKDGHPTWRG